MSNKKYTAKSNGEAGPLYSKTSAIDEKLTNQCLIMHQLLNKRTSKLRELSEDDFCFILSVKWLQEWKDYVNYDRVTGKEEEKTGQQNKKNIKIYPGKINSDIIAKREQQQLFYSIPKEMKAYQYLNTIIQENKKKDQDYIAITKDIWDRFLHYYQGTQIKRPIRRLQGTTFYEADSLRCDVIFVNLYTDKLEQKINRTPKKSYFNLFNKNKMLLPTIWNMRQLKQFLGQYCDLTFKHSDFRIWLGFSYYSSDILVENLVESIKNKKYEIQGRELTEERYADKDISSYIKTTNTLIIEIGDMLKSDQTFDDTLIGLCQFCLQKRQLIISCMCLQVVYCSRKCRIYDQSYHFNTCSVAFDSDSDKDVQDKQLEDIPKIGFKNLGNTCYMNSVTQVLLSLDYFRQFFSKNTYLNHLNQKELQDNNCIFLRKLSKTIKSIYLQKEDAYVPWPLKGQVDYNISPFRGDKQQDANDFLVNFLNVINDYLKKDGEKAYHWLLEPFIGEFHSKVICPTCKIESENNEIFLQLSLPIKSKSKQQFYQYTVIESVRKYVKGKAQILNSWMVMKKKIQADQSLVFSLKQPEGLLQIRQSQKNPAQAIRLSRGELYFYKNISHSEGEQIFIFNLVTTNIVVKQIKRTPYGLPIPLSVDYIQKTLGTFWLQIVKTFFSDNILICQQADTMQRQYFTRIEDLFKKQKKEGDQQQATNLQQQQQQYNQMFSKVVTLFNNKLRLFCQKIGIEVYIITTKKTRSICKFCNTKCNGCHLPKQFDTPFQDFFSQKFKQVKFEVLLRDPLPIQTKQVDKQASGQPCIQDCLALFSQPQQLDQENAWYCSKCDAMCLALKQMHVKTFPPLLILHINRFKNVEGKKQKNNEPILYSEVERFGDFSYRLIGAVIHQGTMDTGHYWSIALRGDKYYVFNDSRVSEIQNVFNRNAYILLYQRFNFAA